MTPKERWLAALRMEPVDRLPFWPKLDAAYLKAWSDRFGGAALPEIHGFIGSEQQEGVSPCVREIRDATAVEFESDGPVSTTVYRTPLCDMTARFRFDEPSQSRHPIEFPIKNVRDVRAMTCWYADARVEADEEMLVSARTVCRSFGDSAIVAATIGESPLMYFVEWLAGIENAHFLLADHPVEVRDLFDAIHRVLLERTRLACETAPSDVLYFSENTSTTLISPAQYREFCLPHITAYGEIARSMGRTLILHMCGHLKRLLPELSTLPAAGFEAFTSPTLGDTTLLDGRMGCPDKCLIGGTNAMLWTRPAGEIIAQLQADLDALPHHRGIVVTSGGVMPPMCAPETIREVCEWVHGYPVRSGAGSG